MMAIKLFEKTLTSTDTTKRLSVPTKALPSLVGSWEGNSANLRVMFKDREWRISCTKRKIGYNKPVLSKGWVPFVRRNQLKVGDRVSLYKEAAAGDGCSSYRIRVKRSSDANDSPTPERKNRVKRKRRYGSTKSGNALAGKLPDQVAGNCRYSSPGNDGVAADSESKERAEMADSSFSAVVAEEHFNLAPASLQQGGLNMIPRNLAVGGCDWAGSLSESFWGRASSSWSCAPGGSLVSGSLITWDGPEPEASSWAEFTGSDSVADEMEGSNLELTLAPPTVEDLLELKCIDFLGIGKIN